MNPSIHNNKIYDIIIRNGMIYDGSGNAPFRGDIAIQGDAIAAVGDLGEAYGKQEIDVDGLAVAPGFINMLSWSVESLIEDGRSQSEIRQGVTLEIMGEGTSMGPVSDTMKAAHVRGILGNTRIKYDIEWTTLGDYLEWLEQRGVSCNIASFVGTGTLRVHAMGYDDRPATEDEMDQMGNLVREAMEEGAMGMSAALIYPPASYAQIDELVSLAGVVAEYDGLYISHIRDEGNTLLEAVDEFLEIAQATDVRAEIYHLKAAGPANWDKMDEVIRIVEEARAEGLPVTADMYTYPYSGTGLSSCIPPWAHEGGEEKLRERLKNPTTRQRIKQEMQFASDTWENMYQQNRAEKILLSGFRKDELKHLTGKTLAQISAMRGTSPEDTLMDLLVEDESRIFTIYFTMSEDNVRKEMALPWVSFCSDAESQAPEGVFLQSNPHPRAYGSFARVLGKYVREEGIIPLEEAVRRLTSFPAANLKIEGRGWLKEGYFADVVVFDPATIQDHATPEKPHQYATGMKHVFVNGVQVLRDGEHTDARPGRVVRGPGYGKKPFEFAYPAKLHPLLQLGDDYDGTYAEFNLGKDLIPDLIRMMTDEHLYISMVEDENSVLGFAPIHAAWRLAQLDATEALKPMIGMLNMPHPIIIQEMPDVFATYGGKSIPALAEYISDPNGFIIGRTAAVACLRRVGDVSPHDVQMICEAILIKQLEKHRDENPLLNSLIATALQSVGSQQAMPLIEEALEAGTIIMGFDEEMEGFDPDTSDEDVNYDFLPNLGAGVGFGNRKPKDKTAARKKKTRRKQTAKLKKQQRKKKR